MGVSGCVPTLICGVKLILGSFKLVSRIEVTTACYGANLKEEQKQDWRDPKKTLYVSNLTKWIALNVELETFEEIRGYLGLSTKNFKPHVTILEDCYYYTELK